MFINWGKTEVVGGVIYASQDIDGYDIYHDIERGFYVRSEGTQWEPIGPLDDFKAAEDIVVKIGITLAQYEEMLWKVLAAQALKVLPPSLDGTSGNLDDALIEAVAGPAGSH
jgi:hypothetical protein